MSPYIFRLTLGQIVGQRRTILILLFAAIPILLAVIFRIASTARNDPLEFYAAIFETLIIGLTLPLTALVFGTAALGQDIEDGTATYLLSKPVPRWQIVVEKTAAAWVITTIMLVASVSATGIVLLADEDGQRTIVAFTLAAALGALAYGALFVCLSVFFNRALIIG
ncbi:MAG TPA: ABC transporter permease subunit, partial [Dehalococcoidia bacterium]|nr:ABC transporter permease subunit [Dehalococcoidia bacterium]